MNTGPIPEPAPERVVASLRPAPAGTGRDGRRGRDATDETGAPSTVGIHAEGGRTSLPDVRAQGRATPTQERFDVGHSPSRQRLDARRGTTGSRTARTDRTAHTARTVWPEWAQAQLLNAVALARRPQPTQMTLGAWLYRQWYAPVIGRRVELDPTWKPLAGRYRASHAASRRQWVRVERLGASGDELPVLERHDALGADGWWRTWSPQWTPASPPSGLVRVHLSARPDAVPRLVGELTTALPRSNTRWLIACTTDVDRLRRAGSIVVSIPHADLDQIGLSALARKLRPLLRTVNHPLCLPVAPGVALADDRPTGMRFGENRCHLIALALASPGARRAPLSEIAEVFRSHGLDPGAPHREA